MKAKEDVQGIKRKLVTSSCNPGGKGTCGLACGRVMDWDRCHTSLKTLMASEWCSTGSRVRGIFKGTVSIPKEGS